MPVPAHAIERTEPDLWRALASPIRRRLLDDLRERPMTTGELADRTPELSRFAVMQHLGVLVDAGVVVVRRRGRNRFNHLNAMPLREWYERWVSPLAGETAGELLALKRHVEDTTDMGGSNVAVKIDQVRIVRIENELRFRASPQRVFEALTTRVREWFPASYGGDRTVAVVIEPRAGGTYSEDWGDGAGYLYGHVTTWDPPRALALRGRITPGSILDTEYELQADGADTILRASKVAVGPMSEAEAAGIHRYGDLTHFEAALRAVIEG